MSNDERIADLASRLKQRVEVSAAVLGLVREFADSLFAALETAVASLFDQAAVGFEPEITRRPTQSGGELLQFNWVSGRIIVAPVQVVAAADPDFELFQGEGPFGRVVVFRELIADTTPFPVCEIYVHSSGTFRARGLGFPTQGNLHVKHDVESLAVTLLENLSGNITEIHKGLHETQLDTESLEVLPRVGFEVPAKE